jgi:2,4-dienoyl-CoA reductase-like NADH-dependent reductase (Old Yellow Enzyme family)
VKLPLIYVGGLLSGEKIDEVLEQGFEFVALARALICEPDFVNRLQREGAARSQCISSNYCIARMYSIEMACHQHIADLPACLQKEVCQKPTGSN